MDSIAGITEKMIAYSRGNLHDIHHWLKVWGYARTIGMQKGLSPDEQFVLEVAAITHDIACPALREKYGNTNHVLQETEGAPMVRTFLADTGMPDAWIERVAFLVGHHHTLENVDGRDWQILLEADYLVNAGEKGYSREAVMNFLNAHVRTESGKRMTRLVFALPEEER